MSTAFWDLVLECSRGNLQFVGASLPVQAWPRKKHIPNAAKFLFVLHGTTAHPVQFPTLQLPVVMQMKVTEE